MVNTSDFPQADRLEQVGLVAIAISKGNRADDEIENYIGLDSAGRQGRYYRLAAEILGLITNEQNYAVLTVLGKEYAGITTQSARTDFLARCLIDTPVFREALNYITKYNPTNHQLKQWFRGFYPGAESTADRRFVTFMNYMRDADLLKRFRNPADLGKYTGVVVKEVKPSEKGITGRLVDKAITAQPLNSCMLGDIIRVDIDAQKRERANQIHWQLVAAKSSFLNERSYQPYENEHIDLFTNSDDGVILYEMKSVDPQRSNLLSQVRKAVAQLYEYRYIFNEPTARLCIVTNADIPTKDRWMIDYLSKDRSIAYEWTEDFKLFECDNSSSKLLEEFSP